MSHLTAYFDLLEASWPAARVLQQGPITLREGQGGGSRVSAASVTGPVSLADIEQAEATMLAMGQQRLFMVPAPDQVLDQQLADRGYRIKDPVDLWTCPSAQLCDLPLPRVTTFCVWDPLAIQKEIWSEGGIGPERLAIMDRVQGAKTAILGRMEDTPIATAFVAVHDGRAMLHALEVRAAHRRKGMGQWMLRQAAIWARDQGAQDLCLLATRANTAANGLYARLGMRKVAGYHYRVRF